MKKVRKELESTVARNQGGDGSGIYVYTFKSIAHAGHPILSNTILVSHTGGIIVNDSMTSLEATWWD